jgi:hypothetical protein
VEGMALAASFLVLLQRKMFELYKRENQTE